MTVSVLNSKKVSKMIKNKEFKLIIDLRQKDSYFMGHLPGAINIPTNEINDNIEYIRNITNANILLYCTNGSQSVTIGKILILNGFNNVYSLADGIKYYKYELYK